MVKGFTDGMFRSDFRSPLRDELSIDFDGGLFLIRCDIDSKWNYRLRDKMRAKWDSSKRFYEIHEDKLRPEQLPAFRKMTVAAEEALERIVKNTEKE